MMGSFGLETLKGEDKMPYIDPDRREAIDSGETADTPGELAYILYSACLYYLDTRETNFVVLNDIVGVLDNVKMEFIRQEVVPYEDKKMLENGDI